MPEANIILVHGQMPERELEDRMLRFTHGEADVLLCTTIIESGLDVPRANTILIDRADALGLAQLYQLRGRVGRSNQARLRVPADPRTKPFSHRTPRSDSRRSRIFPSSARASGSPTWTSRFAVRATCSARSSHGNLAAVGYETYTEMLQETMDELRGKAVQHEVDPEIRSRRTREVCPTTTCRT